MKKISFAKILIFSLLAFVTVSLFFISTIYAAYIPLPGSGPSSSSLDTYGESLREPALNLEQFNLFNLDYTSFGMTKLLIGVPREEGGGVIVQAPPQNYGAFGIMTTFMAGMYTQKPISGVQYFADLGRNLGFIKPAYAQEGGGFRMLGPISELWSISRNLAYLAFVLIFVVIGFMIMLRARIDPRTVATVQAAIPGIVIALILVTLSFALAGLVIDLAQVATRLIANALGPVLTDEGINLGEIRNENIFSLFFGLIEPSSGAFVNIIQQIIASIPHAIARFLGDVIGTGIGQSIIGMIFGFLIVFTAFRVFIMLLTALVTIVLMTIAAPFWFLAAAIPGRGGAIVDWFRSIGGAALAFPITFALLAIAAVFLNYTGPPWNVEIGLGGFRIDLIPFGRFEPRGEGGEIPEGMPPEIPMAQIIGIGILLMTPKVADMIREAFKQRVPEWAGEPGRAIGGMVKRVVPFV